MVTIAHPEKDTQKPPLWAQHWAASRDDPYRFVVGVMGIKPPEWVRPPEDDHSVQMEPWQAKVLKAIRDGERRISIRSGHGTGKTALMSWLVLWALLCHKDSKIPFGANSQDQLRDTVWPEFGKWAKHLPEPLQEQIEVQGERVVIKADPESAFCVRRTCTKENSEALAGFHANFLMFLIDEASGVPDIIFEVALGALSTPGAIQIMTGNPTRNSGYFHDSHHKDRARWWTIRVNSEDVPRARGHIDDVIKKYGKDSNEYRVRVLGEFPLADDDTMIPLELVEAATNRDVHPTRVKPIWGVDVARFGDDRSVIIKRRGNVILEPPIVMQKRDTMVVAGHVVKEYEKTDEVDRPHEICVDVIGIGAGVVDRLDELGLPVRGVNVGESPSVKGQYMKLRDELWWAVREWFDARDVRIPDHQELISELIVPTYKTLSVGKIQVERKDEVKKRVGRSPDLADALMLTFASHEVRQENTDRHRARSAGRQASAWAA